MGRICFCSCELPDRRKRANHIRWCEKNPKRKDYNKNLSIARAAAITKTSYQKQATAIKAAWTSGKYKNRKKPVRILDLSNKRTYWEACKFRFNLGAFPAEFDLSLISTHGMYKATNHGGDGKSGAARDHRVSVYWGFHNQVPPEIIRHPANCELTLQQINNLKKRKCSITLEELTHRIQEWDLKYGARVY